MRELKGYSALALVYLNFGGKKTVHTNNWKKWDENKTIQRKILEIPPQLPNISVRIQDVDIESDTDQKKRYYPDQYIYMCY